jgi:capsular polysaccharide transport system permease protein
MKPRVRRFRTGTGTGPGTSAADGRTAGSDDALSAGVEAWIAAAQEDGRDASGPAAPPRAVPPAASGPGGVAAEGALPAQPTARRTVADEVLAPAELSAEAEREGIRAEGLSARQLRMARRVAQRHGIDTECEIEAVRLLRARGIDPFQPTGILDLVPVDNGRGPRSGDGSGDEGPAQLPQSWQPPGPPDRAPMRLPTAPAAPRPPRPPASESAQIQQIQRDIARRRRRRMALLFVRLVLFVLLPTALVGWYYHQVATPLFSTNTEFVIQQADAPAAASGMGQLFSGTALATSQDAVTVQSFLQSREAMRRLDAEHGFRAHFSGEGIDPLLRLPPDATLEAAYRLYGRVVRIGYDPSEGLVRMEVRATDPATAVAFAQALISYAEEQVDQLTQRLREDQMRGARTSFEEAEARMQEAQMNVVELQERFSVLSSEVEVGLLTNRIAALEAQLTEDRLTLQEMLANPLPSRARVDPLERRIANLEAEIARLRAQLTEGAGDTLSIARIGSELVMAEADVETRRMLLAQALTQLEAARIEANRQVRYLSLGVRPVEPDEPSHPRVVENTALAFLIFAGIYLMLSMTVSILREQVSA